jgi:hypothetical protein
VAGDTELRELRHFAPREQLGQMGTHHAGDADKQLCLPEIFSGRRIRRGKARGTLTMATSLALPKASTPLRRTMKFSALLATCGGATDPAPPASAGAAPRA